MRGQESELAAVEWALGVVESQLREEPAHRLRNRERDYDWSLTAPNGVSVYVEAVRATTAASAAIEFDLSAGVTGWLPGHARGNRRLLLPLEGCAEREPAPLYLVFETGGHVYAFESLEEAGDSIEAIDLEDGHYVAAFSDQGEAIVMRPGDLWVEFTPSGTFDHDALTELIRGSRSFNELAEDPHRFALAIWRAS